MAETRQIVVCSPINIALVKYWGKRDSSLMLPLNDSISVSIDSLFARTKISLSSDYGADSVTVNGKQMDCAPSSRFHICFSEVRRLLRKRKHSDDEIPDLNFKIKAESTTNFPVEAGLASSAAGFAALAYGIGKIFDFDDQTICRIARLGSGSACRSILEGIVYWRAGILDDGSDCTCESEGAKYVNCATFRSKPFVASGYGRREVKCSAFCGGRKRQKMLAKSSHWPELRAIIAVTSGRAKLKTSTIGMETSVNTSELLSYRIKKCVPERIDLLKKAIADKDFEAFAKITMKESNQLHAICLDTDPPLQYMTDGSWHLVRLVTAYNNLKKRLCVAYTFDAGPNCCLFVEENDLNEFLLTLLHYCRPSWDSSAEREFIRGCGFEEIIETIPRTPKEHLEGIEPMTDSLLYIVVSTVGKGPKVESMEKG